MAKYRALEDGTFISEGKVVSVKAGRTVELDDDQALSLAGRIAPIEEKDSMFPGGAPIIGSHITRAVAPHDIVGEPTEVPEVAPEPTPTPKTSSPKKPEDK
jgi:hypothetical protein